MGDLRGGLTRRSALTLAGAAVAYASAQPWAWAEGRSGLHGLSIFGDLKYPRDFAHFDYVNPQAPKGGRMNYQVPNWILNQSPQTFNTLNSFVLRGDAPPRMGLVFDSLMARATDEADAVYGLVAETVDVSDDASIFTFHLRPEARFHDGTPVTAEDVAFSLTILRDEGHPLMAEPMRPLVSADVIDTHTVALTLSDERSRDTILSLVGVPIFSKAYYADRTFDASTLDPPLGSGPYKVGRMAAGRYIEYDRVPDYWAADLPVSVGFSNFDVIRIDFFAERQAAFEAFKKGEITFREEFTSITWANDYNFPAVTEGKVVRSTDIESDRRPSFQGFFFNTRRARFRDPLTRQAIALAFDFEWSNPNLFFDAYERQSSLFGRSDFAAVDPPDAAELAILEPFRGELPDDVFGAPYVPPETDGSGRDRTILRQASDLLAEAGWRQMGSTLVDEMGAPFEVEFLINAAVFERIIMPYVENLRALGIDATLRQVDPTQYQARTDNFDYDIVMSAISMTPTPLDGLPQIFGSSSADRSGSYNFAGVKEPAIDAALAKLPSVESRDELITITRVIDRVFRAKHYWNPAWQSGNRRLAYWDIFDHPPVKPDYAFTPETTWWFDAARAEAIGYEP